MSSDPRIFSLDIVEGEPRRAGSAGGPSGQAAGVEGGRSIIELGHGPVLLRANEARDGALHSLCCVSPSTKETTLHHWRDPILERLAGTKGAARVSRIQFRVGPLPEILPLEEATAVQLPELVPPPKDPVLDAALTTIGDDDLRAVVARAAKRSLSRVR